MRNLKKDLETCRKATPGAWSVVHGNKDQVVGSRERGIAVTIGENKQHNANFIAEAREGWPGAIKWAIEAEKALDLACERMKEQCPANALCMGYCEKENCENNVAKCWKEYFFMKARESHDRTRHSHKSV